MPYPGRHLIKLQGNKLETFSSSYQEKAFTVCSLHQQEEWIDVMVFGSGESLGYN